MSLRCANPLCESKFDHRQGQLIRAPRQDDDSSGEVRHFWLCGPCAEQYFLEYRRDRGVIMKPQPTRRTVRERARIAAA